MKILACFFILVFAASCKKEIEDEKIFPIEPYIEFRNLEFKDSPKIRTYDPDTLILEFYFRDGDFDLGLDPNVTKEPYNELDYFLKSTGKKYIFPDNHYSEEDNLISKLPELITYKDRNILGMDTLPKFVKPYDCTNWRVLSRSQKIIDTVYIRYNLNRFNIFLKYYTQTNTTWELFDFNSFYTYPLCENIGFNGSFPPIENFPLLYDNPFFVKKISTNEGILIYKMRSSGFKFIFGNKKIKLRIKIQDRALHKSNEIETPEIQL